MKTIQAIITESEAKVGVALNSVDTLVGTTHDDLQKSIVKIVKAAVLDAANCSQNLELLSYYAKEKLQADFDDAINESAAREIAKLAEKLGFEKLAQEMLNDL
jgi:isocitrate dehydrogenase